MFWKFPKISPACVVCIFTMNAYHRPFLFLFNCLPPWPASPGGRVHSLSFGCISQDPKIVPGIQWALKSIHRMHQQILIFTFTSQVLVLHYKCHSSSPIMPFHYFFAESSLLFPEHFLFFCTILCSSYLGFSACSFVVLCS